MIPPSLLGPGRERWEVVPNYLTAADFPWLRALLDEYDRFEGRRWCELRQRLREPLTLASPADKLRLATVVLDGLWRQRVSAVLPPRRARAALFAAAARERDRDRAIAQACGTLGVEPTELFETLLADLPAEQRVAAPPELPSVAALAQQVNAELVAGIIRRSIEVRVQAHGNVRALVRQAKLRGLLCWVSARPRRAPGGRAPAAELRISGPLSLFRRTLVYGRALAGLVERLAWCERFELRAPFCLASGDAVRELVVRSGDPIAPGRPLRRFDSAVEERFAREFARAAPDWDLVREPEAIRVGEELFFPDFALQHRRDPTRYWLLEIMGFWTRDYVERKLELVRRAGLERLILCIDAARQCADGRAPAAARVIHYRRRIAPEEVLAVIEAAR